MSNNHIICGDEQNFESQHLISFGKYIWNALIQHDLDQIAEQCLETNEFYTFRQLLIKSQNLARKLIQLKNNSSNILLLCTGNELLCSPCMIGCFLADYICFPLSSLLGQDDYENLFKTSEPYIIVVNSKVYPLLKSSCKNIGLNPYFLISDNPQVPITDENTISLHEIFTEINYFDPTFMPVDLPNDELKNKCLLMICSSGTTGSPKVVCHSHFSILYHTRYFEYSMRLYEGNCLVASGPFWATGIIFRFWSMNRGQTNYILPRLSTDLFLKSIDKFKIVSTSVSPPFLGILTKEGIKKYDISSLKILNFSGSLIPEDTLIKAREIFKGVHVRSFYGLTEVLTMFEPTDLIPKCVGKLGYSAQAKVISIDTGLNLPANCSGELCFKSPVLMMGYYKNPSATSDAIDNDGWLHTGDYGYYDEDKNFYLLDRIKLLIKYKGNHVNSSEIEGVLYTHPAVLESCVIGIPHPTDWEHARAMVIKKPNTQVTEQELILFIQERLHEHKWLHGGVQFANYLPKTPSDKYNRIELKKLIK